MTKTLHVIAAYGTTCYLCGDAIDISLPSNTRLSFTIDHVVARVMGGDDSLENLRPAHMGCNSRKVHRDRKAAQA